MKKVTKEAIVAMFDRYSVGKLDSFDLRQEQEDLLIFGELIANETWGQFYDVSSNEERYNVIRNNIIGTMIIMYTLLKNQIEIEELEEQWN